MSASGPTTTNCRRKRSALCSSGWRGRASGCSGSRAAIRSCSAAAARRSRRWPTHGVPFQVCPGVTAAIGASAYAGIPLTHRDHAQACVFVTGHGRDGKIDLDWTALIQPRQTVAIYMGLRNLRGADRRVRRPRRERRPACRDRRQRDAAQPAGRRGHARNARGAGPRRRTAGRRSSLSARWSRCADKLDWYAPAALNAEQAVKTAVNDRN